MAYIKYQQVASVNAVRSVAELTVPDNATHVEIQSSGNHVHYTMDGVTNPNTAIGMILLTTEPPKTFLIEDLKSIRFTRNATGNGFLNLHYFGGRDI